MLGQNALKAIDKTLKGDAKWNAVAVSIATQPSAVTPATSTECKAYFRLVKQHIKLKKKREARAASSMEQYTQRNAKGNVPVPTAIAQQLPSRSTTAALRVSLQGLELQGLAVLQAARMHLQVSCKRCKTTTEATLSEEAPWTASCSKCCADIDMALKTEMCNTVSIILRPLSFLFDWRMFRRSSHLPHQSQPLVCVCAGNWCYAWTPVGRRLCGRGLWLGKPQRYVF
eukprot:COSAG02_NODE_5793_length_4032_cov_4.410120_3_plen_228_part_00